MNEGAFFATTLYPARTEQHLPWPKQGLVKLRTLSQDELLAL